MGISSKKNLICDNDCTNCKQIKDCDHVDYEQVGFGFEFDIDAINWDDIPEIDIAPEASKEIGRVNTFGQKITPTLEEIEIQERTEALEDKKSSRVLNEFLKKYASKLLKYSMIAIIVLYIIDLIVSMTGLENSKFVDPLFTLLQTIIMTVIGYLIGSNQNKD